MAIDVNRAVLDDIMIPTLGLTIDIALVVIVETPPNNISVIIKSIFFLFKLLYSFYNYYYQT